MCRNPCKTNHLDKFPSTKALSGLSNRLLEMYSESELFEDFHTSVNVGWNDFNRIIHVPFQSGGVIWVSKQSNLKTSVTEFQLL